MKESELAIIILIDSEIIGCVIAHDGKGGGGYVIKRRWNPLLIVGLLFGGES